MREDADPHHGGANRGMRHFVPKVMDQRHQQNISSSYDLKIDRITVFRVKNSKQLGFKRFNINRGPSRKNCG